MSDTKRTAIYITLVCLGVVLTTLFVIMLSYNVRVFLLLLTLYLIGYSVYNFTFMMLTRDKFKDDLRYDVAKYMALFNMFFGASIFVLSIVFMNRILGNTPQPVYR